MWFGGFFFFFPGEKPFLCEADGCGRSFAEYSSLRKHMLVHSGEWRSSQLDSGSLPFVRVVSQINTVSFKEMSSIQKGTAG